jgi:hypothetical protein
MGSIDPFSNGSIHPSYKNYGTSSNCFTFISLKYTHYQHIQHCNVYMYVCIQPMQCVGSAKRTNELLLWMRCHWATPQYIYMHTCTYTYIYIHVHTWQASFYSNLGFSKKIQV